MSIGEGAAALSIIERISQLILKPYIIFGKLERTSVNVTLTPFWKNPPEFQPKTFDGIVWRIKVYNRPTRFAKIRVSRTATECFILVRLFTNGKDTRQVYPLGWLSDDVLPKETKYGEPIGTDEEYDIALPFTYVGNLLSLSNSSIMLPDGNENELLFAFSFPNSGYLYLVTQISEVLRRDQMIRIPFDRLKDYIFVLLVNWEGHRDKQGKKFKINMVTWDKMNLVWI